MNKLEVKIEKVERMKCPECLNYMTAKVLKDGTVKGTCPVCKSSIFSKQHSRNVRYIKIVKHTL